ncbi:hypothetical protein N9Y89_00165 [bacterium]|nr:hypothetical protein [bacterium]
MKIYEIINHLALFIHECGKVNSKAPKKDAQAELKTIVKSSSEQYKK